MGCLTSADKRAASIGYSPYKCGYTSSSREVKKLSPGGFIKEDVEYEMPIEEDDTDSMKREKMGNLST